MSLLTFYPESSRNEDCALRIPVTHIRALPRAALGVNCFLFGVGGREGEVEAYENQLGDRNKNWGFSSLPQQVQR